MYQAVAYQRLKHQAKKVVEVADGRWSLTRGGHTWSLD